MTARPMGAAKAAAGRLPPLPDPPKNDMQQINHFHRPGLMTILAMHFGAMLPGATTLVSGQGYLCRRRSDLPSCPYPDLVIAFDVDAETIDGANGYVIEEVGKPPDLVLEVASHSTGRRDYIGKRDIYAGLGVPEYWRFDHTGGRHHNAPLAGDLLVNGAYRPIATATAPDGVIWARSEALSLSLCWAEGRLRFWYPAQQRYLPEPPELADALAESQARVNTAEAQAAGERQAREAAEARIRALEEELRRRQNR